MRLARPSRFAAALIAIISMLFMQLAVASYACPGMKMGHSVGTVTMTSDSDDQGMAGCAGMDMEQPSLCHAYGHEGKQSLDIPELPQVQPFVAAGLAVEVRPLEIAILLSAIHEEFAPLTRATAPPISIRNCCFRI